MEVPLVDPAEVADVAELEELLGEVYEVYGGVDAGGGDVDVSVVGW